MKLLLTILLTLSFNTNGAPHALLTKLDVPQSGMMVIGANKQRKLLIIQNVNGAGTITIKLDSLPADNDDGIVLASSSFAFIELPISNSLYARSSSAQGDTLVIIEVLK